MLNREEYIEQGYFFRVLSERLPDNKPLQEVLEHVREELLATTKLPLAVGYLLNELKHSGVLAPAMRRLPHYFTTFQTYVIDEAENEQGRFDMRVAIELLRHEAEYRSKEPTRQGTFLYQFEALCRNRLQYDAGLEAMAGDPIYDDQWREWIFTVRRQVGIVDFADLIYVRSEYYVVTRRERGQTTPPAELVLFGEKEGKIAFANRRKDPLYLFAALQRQLGYPAVSRPQRPDEAVEMLPQLLRRMERLETRIKLMEEEQRGGIDLVKFYEQK